MRTLVRTAIVAATLACTVTAAAASEVMEFLIEGRGKITGDDSYTDGAALDVDWQAELRLGLLMGEPVVSVHFRHEILGGTVTLPVLGTGPRRYETARYRDLSPELQNKIRLTEVKLDIRLASVSVADAATYLLQADVGATGKQGDWSYNVPGSPDWDELLLIDYAGGLIATEQLPADKARAAWKTGFTIAGAEIGEAKINLYDMHAAYMKTGRESYRAMQAANDRLIEGVRASYGFDASDSPDAWNGALLEGTDLGSVTDWQARQEALGAFLGKLADLPDALRSGDNHAPYEQAVADANLLLRSIRYDALNFTPEGVSPDSYPKGREPEFGGDEIPRFFANLTDAFERDGNRLEELNFWYVQSYHRVSNRFIVDRGYEGCEDFNDRDGLPPVRAMVGDDPDLSMVDCNGVDMQIEVHGEGRRYGRLSGEILEMDDGEYNSTPAKGYTIRIIHYPSREFTVKALYHFDADFNFIGKE